MGLGDLAQRLDALNKRIARLETLEFGTVAFPSGGIGALCDTITGPGLVGSVTCPVPTGHRHLMAIVGAAGAATGNFLATPKIRVTINAIVAGYEYATREERRFVIGDTEAVALIPAAFWETIPQSRGSFLPSTERARNSALYIFPDPDVIPGEVANDAAWIGGARDRSTGPLVLGIANEDDLGGGFNLIGAPITSITWTIAPPDLFYPGSRFTVYAL